MAKMKWLACGAGAVLAAWAALLAGCEEVESDTALAIDPDKAELSGVGATVVLSAYDPDETTYARSALNSDVNSATNLSAQMLLPLEWRVSDPGLGRIASSAGYSAIYESFGGEGQNYVSVQDRYARQGVAVVSQRFPVETNTTDDTDTDTDTDDDDDTTSPTNAPPEPTIAITPSSVTLTNAGASVVFSVENVDSDDFPLSWSVSNPNLGRILSSAGNTAIYERYAETGNNVVMVVAGNGQEANAVVVQP